MFTTPYTHTTEFSKNHNGKLIMQYFPTVRLLNNKKYFTGAVHKITFKNLSLGIAEIVAVREFPYKFINDNLSYIDCEMNAEKAKGMFFNMYKNRVENFTAETKFVHVIFNWIERGLAETNNLLMTPLWDEIKEKFMYAHKEINYNN